MSADEPIYNIGIVSQMTNTAETTLRMWERRYDFPEAARSEGGHRLYSANQVKRIQWVKRQMEAGMQVSKAIKALRQQESEIGLESSDSISESSVDGIVSTLFSALLAHDLQSAEQIIAEAVILHSLDHIILHVISPVLSHIGQAWEDNRISVATEHLATNFLKQQLLLWMRIGPPTYDVPPILLACAPDELHEVSLLIIGVLLRRLRWPVSYLGASVPIDDLISFIYDIQPAFVVMVAMTQATAVNLQQLNEWLDETPLQTVIGFGGRVFVTNSELIDEMPGIYLGNTLDDGLKTLRELLSEKFPWIAD